MALSAFDFITGISSNMYVLLLLLLSSFFISLFYYILGFLQISDEMDFAFSLFLYPTMSDK